MSNLKQSKVKVKKKKPPVLTDLLFYKLHSIWKDLNAVQG